MNKHIAVTGATGFVGQHLLCQLISKGYKVTALTRRPQKPIENVHWILGDFESASSLRELVQDADVVINVAGLVKAPNLDDFQKANSIAVDALMNAIKSANKIPYFIQISSLTAREPTISDYARSKFDGEEKVKNNNLNLNWTILRPPGIYGPKDTETLKIFNLIKWHLALFPANRHHRVSWIHVFDLVKAITFLIESNDHFSQIIEIDDGHEKGYSHEEFFKISSDIMGISPLKITLPQCLLRFIGHTNDILGHIVDYVPMVSVKKTNELCHSNWVVDKTKTIKGSEWRAEYDLQKGLKETLDWYKNN
ncbi:MAG: NAD(P)-dependent oxidoreductase [Kordiimonadaceae bacterium]|jgi:nucleoside-diphosphate-sugar epimerase|nr:NAD(P)-dependent oxidoreductase [Kordiimonadaceae bacterium]MBT6033496.1 NAD(P)-dependent oxidoreductase [Kordiimonadaceae bacterium]